MCAVCILQVWPLALSVCAQWCTSKTKWTQSCASMRTHFRTEATFSPAFCSTLKKTFPVWCVLADAHFEHLLWTPSDWLLLQIAHVPFSCCLLTLLHRFFPSKSQGASIHMHYALRAMSSTTTACQRLRYSCCSRRKAEEVNWQHKQDALITKESKRESKQRGGETDFDADELFSGRMEEEEVKDGSFNSRKWTPDCESDWHSRSITLLLLENSAKTYCF